MTETKTDIRDEIVETYRQAIEAGPLPDGDGGTRPWTADDVAVYQITAEDWDTICGILGYEPTVDETRIAEREAREIVTATLTRTDMQQDGGTFALIGRDGTIRELAVHESDRAATAWFAARRGHTQQCSLVILDLDSSDTPRVGDHVLVDNDGVATLDNAR